MTPVPLNLRGSAKSKKKIPPFASIKQKISNLIFHNSIRIISTKINITGLDSINQSPLNLSSVTKSILVVLICLI